MRASALSPEERRRLQRAAERVRAAEQRRDELVADLWSAGASQRELAELLGLSRPTIAAIIRRVREGAA